MALSHLFLCLEICASIRLSRKAMVKRVPSDCARLVTRQLVALESRPFPFAFAPASFCMVTAIPPSFPFRHLFRLLRGYRDSAWCPSEYRSHPPPAVNLALPLAQLLSLCLVFPHTGLVATESLSLFPSIGHKVHTIFCRRHNFFGSCDGPSRPLSCCGAVSGAPSTSLFRLTALRFEDSHLLSN